ncbi:MAG: vWA domain-containing protein, partial [Deltaproteobacteria bacterium]
SALQLLVDTSGSMDQDAPGGRGTKWTVTRRAVLDAVDGMPADTSLGVTFYPNVPNDRQPCIDRRAAVGLAPLAATGSQQRQQIRNAFQRQTPQGGTPTHDAYRYALGEVGATAVAGSRFLVLITDGIPTYSLGCVGTGRNEDPVDPSPLVSEAASALAQGVRTFVIGSPGSEGARESLSRMAEAGGTARDGCSHTGRPSYCHFDMTSESDLGAGLANALEAISGLALSCRYDIPEPPNGSLLEPGKVNVLFRPPGGAEELILRSPGQACSEGWQYSSGNDQIQLCGSTCDRVRTSNGGLTLQFGCSTQVR